MGDLARRAVACERWRWLPGMVVNWRRGRSVTRLRLNRSNLDGAWTRAEEKIPDLTDPGTSGCLLALVREAWGMPRLWIKWWPASAPDMSGADHSFCEAVDRMGRRVVPGPRVRHPNEIAALVAALEAAPR